MRPSVRAPHRRSPALGGRQPGHAVGVSPRSAAANRSSGLLPSHRSPREFACRECSHSGSCPRERCLSVLFGTQERVDLPPVTHTTIEPACSRDVQYWTVVYWRQLYSRCAPSTHRSCAQFKTSGGPGSSTAAVEVRRRPEPAIHRGPWRL